MKVKLFWVNAPMKDKGLVWADSAGNANAFESQINSWLSENPGIQIHHIKQSSSGGSLHPALWLVSVWYSHESA